MTTGPANSKPPRARSSAPAAVPGPLELARLERRLRRLVKVLAPELRIERKWANDWYAGTDLVLCIGRFTRHVGIEFWRGSQLVDSGFPLDGTGKNLRHIKVRAAAELEGPPLRKLIRAAVQLDRASPKRAR